MESHLGECKAKITQSEHERWEGVLPAAGKETRVISKVINNLVEQRKPEVYTHHTGLGLFLGMLP